MDDYIGDHSNHNGTNEHDARYAKRLQRLQKKLHRSQRHQNSTSPPGEEEEYSEDFTLPPLPPQEKLDSSFGDTPSRWQEAAQTPPVPQETRKKIKRSSMDMLKSYFIGESNTNTTNGENNNNADRMMHHNSTSNISMNSAQRVTQTTPRIMIHDEPPRSTRKKRSSLDMLKSYFHSHDNISSDLGYYQDDDTPSCWPTSHEEQQKLKQDHDRKEKVQRIRETMKKERSERQLQRQQRRRRTSLDHVSPGIHELPQQQQKRAEKKKQKKFQKQQQQQQQMSSNHGDDHAKPAARRLSNHQMYGMDSTRGVTVDLRRASMANGTANHHPSPTHNDDAEVPSCSAKERTDEDNSNHSMTTDFTSSSSSSDEDSDEHNYRSLVFDDVNLNVEDNNPTTKKAVKEALHRTASPNHPHPALEFVPFYGCLRYIMCCCGSSTTNILLPLFKRLLLCCQAKTFWSQRVLPHTLANVDVFVTLGQMSLWSGLVVAKLLFTLYFTMIDPNVTLTGYAAVVSLLLCIWTTCHNSLLTIPFGLSLERAPWYHAGWTYLALVTSVLHTGVAFYFPDSSRTIQQFELQEATTLTNLYPASSASSLQEYEYQHTQELFEKSVALSHSSAGSTPQWSIFLVASSSMNSAGSIMVLGLGLLAILTLLRQQRLWLRQLWQRSLQFVSILTILVASFYHMTTSLWLPLVVSIPWIMDLLIRKVIMRYFWYQRRTASLRLLENGVLEVSFLKTAGFSYNPGQFVRVNIPSVSYWEWQPCPISSSPEQVIVTLLLRKNQNDWTRSLYELCQQNGSVKTTTTVTIGLEGPYGSTSLDLISEHQYHMVTLISSGMGLAPMQSLGNQLLYEQSTGVRQLKQLSMIWMERDPVLEDAKKTTRRRRSSIDHTTAALKGDSVFSQYDDVEVASSGVGQFVPRHNSILQQQEQEEEAAAASPITPAQHPQGIASTLLSLFPPSPITDDELEEMFQNMYYELEQPLIDHTTTTNNKTTSKDDNTSTPARSNSQRWTSLDDDDDDDQSVFSMAESFLGDTYNVDSTGMDNDDHVLELSVYRLSKANNGEPQQLLPFVHYELPKFPELFQTLQQQAIEQGERRVAVCVCAPPMVVLLVQKACVKYSSSSRVTFDIHVQPWLS